MDYNKMYSSKTKLDTLVRQKTSEGWKMFCHEHPVESSVISVIDNAGVEISGVTFTQKYLYKDGNSLGTCSVYRFWK